MLVCLFVCVCVFVIDCVCVRVCVPACPGMSSLMYFSFPLPVNFRMRMHIPEKYGWLARLV